MFKPLMPGVAAAKGKITMKLRLVLTLCCLLSHESAGFAPVGTGVTSFSGLRQASTRNSKLSYRHAEGLQRLRARPAMTMEAEVAGEQETGSGVDSRKKVVVIGAGWAGLAAAYELSKQVKTYRVQRW